MNEESRLPSGLTLGAIIADDCATPVTALGRALQFLPVNRATTANVTHQRAPANSLTPLDFFDVVGVIGPESSPSSVTVANLLSMFNIPQVSQLRKIIVQ